MRCNQAVLGAGQQREALSSEAYGSSRRGELRGPGRALALAAAIRELVITTDPLLVSCCCKKEGILHCFTGVVRWLQLECRWHYLWTRFDCGEFVTVCWQKGVVGGCNYRRRAEYVLQQTAARRQRMDVVEDRQNVASLLSGHQDLTPNSDATRLRFSFGNLSLLSSLYYIFYKATFYLTFCIYTSLLSTPNYNDFRQENVQKLLDFFTCSNRKLTSKS